MSTPSILTEQAPIDLWVPFPPSVVAEVIQSQPRWTFRYTLGQFTGTVEGSEFELRARMRRRWFVAVPRASGTLSPENGGTRVRGAARLPADARSAFRRTGFMFLAMAGALPMAGWVLGWPLTFIAAIVAVVTGMAFLNSSSGLAHAAEWRDEMPNALARALLKTAVRPVEPVAAAQRPRSKRASRTVPTH